MSRTRNFATVVYPDSAPENWMDILTEQFVPAFVSPLHDQDIDPDGCIKKPHYHVMIMFDGVKTTDQASAIFDKIGGVGREIVQSLRGYARYLCHLDNPEKHQYSPEGVRALCGADYMGVIGLPIDRYAAIGDMIDFCDSNSIYSYAQLRKYARSHRPDWFRILCDSGTVVMREFLKSQYWTDHVMSGESGVMGEHYDTPPCDH